MDNFTLVAQRFVLSRQLVESYLSNENATQSSQYLFSWTFLCNMQRHNMQNGILLASTRFDRCQPAVDTLQRHLMKMYPPSGKRQRSGSISAISCTFGLIQDILQSQEFCCEGKASCQNRWSTAFCHPEDAGIPCRHPCDVYPSPLRETPRIASCCSMYFR